MNISVDEPLTLPYGFFAVALYASDMPVSAKVDDQRLLDYARQGVATLGGGSELSLIHNYLLRLNRERVSQKLTHQQYVAALAERWPDQRRLERCFKYDMHRLLSHNLRNGNPVSNQASHAA